ncbi:trypsin-like peptidase domain-containing protein [Mameliella alba]|nr:trypsin-like peptidase domain-containing protein [Antarctobacter heliothermus]MBY6144063.1 trypsin-like peptidase domain-containing protein [Mameliella alba]MCA0954112.1 trypsin-like peptidase domain-containing protein [Mameliella alba]
MFSPLRSVALCCFALSLPAPVLADLVLDKDGAPKKTVNETLVLDPTAKPEKDDGTITIKAKNPTAINPGAPPAKAPNPTTRPPRPGPTPDPVVTLPARNPGSAPPSVLAPSPVSPLPARTPQPRPVPAPKTGSPLLAGAPLDPAPSTDVKPVEEMPYISFAAPAYSDGYEVSMLNNVRGTGRIRVTTDYGPVFCSGFVFGPSVVATSYACVPGVLEDPRVGASKIEEIRIVFDHVFPDQRLWTAQGYVLTLDTELSSKETGLAILHIADPDTNFAPDRIQRVGQTTPDPRSPLYMLSFPRGGSMQIQHCGALPTDPAYLPAKSFEHNCQSDYGDLGAPIFDAGTGAVVGLHLSHELSTGRRFALHSVDLANWIGDQQ